MREEKKRTKEYDDMVHKVVNAVAPQVAAEVKTALTVLEPKLAQVDRSLKNVTKELKKTSEEVQEKTRANENTIRKNEKVIDECVKGLREINTFVRQASVSMAGCRRDPARRDPGGFGDQFAGSITRPPPQFNRELFQECFRNMFFNSNSYFR